MNDRVVDELQRKLGDDGKFNLDFGNNFLYVYSTRLNPLNMTCSWYVSYKSTCFKNLQFLTPLMAFPFIP